MENITTPGPDLWQSVADTTGWVKLTRPDDFQIPALLALQLAERWASVYPRHCVESLVKGDDELYLCIGPVPDRMAGVAPLILKMWSSRHLVDAPDNGNLLTFDAIWASFQSHFASRTDQDPASMRWKLERSTLARFLDRLGYENRTVHIDGIAYRTRPGVQVLTVPRDEESRTGYLEVLDARWINADIDRRHREDVANAKRLEAQAATDPEA